MIIFWILAAGLMGLALFFVALPLLQPEKATEAPEQDELNLTVFKQRMQELDADLASGFLEQDQYAAARSDLERDLLRDIPGETGSAAPTDRSGGRWLAILLAVAVPASAVLLYSEVGHQEIMRSMESAALGGAAPTMTGPDGQELPPLEVLVARLEERMAEDPNNIDGWLMLGRTYFTMSKPARALEAIAKAYGMAADRPDVALAYAEAIAANSGNSLEGKPAELIEQVLAIEPDNMSARWLSGMLYYQRGQFTAAATAWQRILDDMDPASDDASDMREMIVEARTRAGGPPAGVEAPTAPPTSAAPEADDRTVAVPAPTDTDSAAQQNADAMTTVTAEVSLDQAISANAAPEDIVFVFARAVSGPPMPLAVQRIQVKDLPTRVTLDDSMAMMPEMSLSAFPQVMIGARVAKSGQATPQSGDLEGEVGPIASAGNALVGVTINRVRP